MATQAYAGADSAAASSAHPYLWWLRAAVLQKTLALFVAGAIVTLALAAALLLPNRYTATVVLLPPQQSGSSGAVLMAQLSSMSAAAAATGGLSIKNPNDQQIALLKSRIVEEAVVARFHLQSLYGKRYVSSARKRWERETKVDNGLKDGLIRLAVTDDDPRRASEMANGWVEEYKRFTATLAITEASQRRLFYEQQLAGARVDLAHAQEAMKQTELRTGVIDIEGQDRGLIASAGELRGELAAKQIEIRSMRQFAADGNPDLKRAEEEASGMESQLAAMDAGSDRKTGDLIAPKGMLTEAAAEYESALREVKYRETIQDLLMRQYEGARVDEARQGALIQVVEPAVPPDKPTSRYKLWIALAGLLCALPLALVAAVVAELIAILRRARVRSGSWIAVIEESARGACQ
jgi:tyrosine-protein kinase Etk/Wzc